MKPLPEDTSVLTQESYIDDEIGRQRDPKDKREKSNRFIRFVETYHRENGCASLFDAFQEIVVDGRYKGIDIYNVKKSIDKKFIQKLLESANQHNIIKKDPSAKNRKNKQAKTKARK